MLKLVNLKNEEIYAYAVNLSQSSLNNLDLPVKVNFYLQKNIKKIIELGQEIEQARLDICNKYGSIDENENYIFSDEIIDKANQEIQDLIELEQEVKLYMISINSFNDDNIMSSKDFNAISFMLYDDEEEKE